MNTASFAKLLNEVKERRQLIEGEILTAEQKMQLYFELAKFNVAVRKTREGLR